MLPKPKLAKFQKEFKTHSMTKKAKLLDSIRIAKDMIENKGKSDDVKNNKKIVEDVRNRVKEEVKKTTKETIPNNINIGKISKRKDSSKYF